MAHGLTRVDPRGKRENGGGGGGSVQSFELSQKDSELTTPDLMVFKVTWHLRTVKNKIVLKINVGRASPETCMVGSAKIKECY